MTAATVMLQGTASGVGKSLLAAGVCRLLTRRGLAVLPFKAQNMALNAAVTPDGREIGRAQALQALACGVETDPDMNPILLKPEGDRRAQLIVGGTVHGSLSATAYHDLKPQLWGQVRAALDRLRERCDVVVIEGAGSPAEVNLRDRDIVNMRVAAHARSPVILVGDIDRGGVIASLLGTLALLRRSERPLVRAMVVNNFRGDPTLFAGGVAFLERRARRPVLGVVPHLEGLRLPEEDSLGLGGLRSDGGPGGIDVAVVRLPWISNFDDVDPLLRERGVGVRSVEHGADLGRPDLILLPGSKATRSDLRAMRERGLSRAVRGAAAAGSAVLGVCGGFQLLGRRLADPDGIESAAGAGRGLGLLPVSTTMTGEKTVRRVRGRVVAAPGLLAPAASAAVRGYEIHAGRTGVHRPPLLLHGEAGGAEWEDGAASDDGWVVGTHLHGLLEAPALRHGLLRAVAGRRGRRWRPGAPLPGPDADLDRVADAVDTAIGADRLLALVREGLR